MKAVNRKILIIDDEEDFGLLLRNILSPKKLDVFLAYTIAEGMKLLEQEKPDYIFLDNNLPDGYGWGKAEYILTHYPRAQLNLISAVNVPKTCASSFRILEKPLLLEEINKLFD